MVLQRPRLPAEHGQGDRVLTREHDAHPHRTLRQPARRSYNTALLRTAAGLIPAGSTLEIATLHGIPLYDCDAEAREGVPSAMQALKGYIVAADGLLLATPEYNNGIPSVLKDAIDWLSRPPSDIARVFGDRPVAVLGASPGGFGTILAQNA
jgi:chromate reductase